MGVHLAAGIEALLDVAYAVNYLHTMQLVRDRVHYHITNMWLHAAWLAATQTGARTCTHPRLAAVESLTHDWRGMILHTTQVHGDIKSDNVLLKSDASRPHGFTPKVNGCFISATSCLGH